LDKLCLLHVGELLSADHACRSQIEGPKHQWLGDKRNLLYVPCNFSRAAESALLKMVVHVPEKKQCQFEIQAAS